MNTHKKAILFVSSVLLERSLKKIRNPLRQGYIDNQIEKILTLLERKQSSIPARSRHGKRRKR
jgi:hypothetical protein